MRAKKSLKKKPAAPKANHLYLRYTKSESGGEAINPDERWTNYEDAYIDTHVVGIFKNPGVSSYDLSYSEEFEVPKSYLNKSFLWAVGIRYTDGGTFGCTHGYIHWLDLAATEKQAMKLLNDAKNNPKAYKPWEGYFASYEDDEVHYLPVAD